MKEKSYKKKIQNNEQTNNTNEMKRKKNHLRKIA